MVDLLLGLLPVQEFPRKHHRDGQSSCHNLVPRVFVPLDQRSENSGNGIVLATEWPSVVEGNFDPSFSFERAFSCTFQAQRNSITLIWASLERSFPPAEQARVVGKVDNAIHRINHYPVDSVVCLVNTFHWIAR